MSDNTIPVLQPTPMATDAIELWIDAVGLAGIRDDASALYREHSEDHRAIHLQAIITGIRGLIG